MRLNKVNGTFDISKSKSFSFTDVADTLYVDCPLDTGLSYGTKQNFISMDDLTTEFLLFLSNFYSVFPETYGQ
jgi:carboxypeptidase C (cathepsin A)